MIRRILKNSSSLSGSAVKVNKFLKRSFDHPSCHLSQCSRRQIGLVATIKKDFQPKSVMNRNGINERNAYRVQSMRLLSTASEGSKEDKPETMGEDGLPKMNLQKESIELDSGAVENNEQIEKDLKAEQDLWLKLCSNKDPNDNTISPDAFNEKDPWKTQEDFLSSDEYDKSSNQ